MKIGLLKEEKIPEDKRVALTPETAKNIIGLGLKVCIEKKTGPIFVGQGFRKYKQTERMPIFNVIIIEA